MTTKFCFLGGGCRWTQAASGEAGQANAGLCPASSLLSVLILIVFVRNASSITVCRLVAWHSGRTSVSGRRTFPVLRLTGR